MNEARKYPGHEPESTGTAPEMGRLSPGPRRKGLPRQRPPRGSQNPGGHPEGSEVEVPDMGTLNPGPGFEGEERPPRGSQNPGGRDEIPA